VNDPIPGHPCRFWHGCVTQVPPYVNPVNLWPSSCDTHILDPSGGAHDGVHRIVEAFLIDLLDL
jgi:hypothetical protein